MTTVLLFLLYSIWFFTLPDLLYEITKPTVEKYNTNENKYIILFYIANVFCFLFLNKIRENRKINYYKDRIKIHEQLLELKNGYYIPEKYNNEYIRIKRYLKLKKIK